MTSNPEQTEFKEAIINLVRRTIGPNNFMAVIPNELHHICCKEIIERSDRSITPLPRRSITEVLKGTDNREKTGFFAAEIVFTNKGYQNAISSEGPIALDIGNTNEQSAARLYNQIMHRVFERIENETRNLSGRPKVTVHSSDDGIWINNRVGQAENWSDLIHQFADAKKLEHVKIILRSVDLIPQELRGPLFKKLNNTPGIKFIVVTDQQLPLISTKGKREVSGPEVNHDYFLVKL